MRVVVDLLPIEPKDCVFNKQNDIDENLTDCRIDGKLCELCFHSNRCSKLVLIDNIN